MDETISDKVEIDVRIEMDMELDKKKYFDPDKGLLISLDKCT
jgi:hypothetical protein